MKPPIPSPIPSPEKDNRAPRDSRKTIRFGIWFYLAVLVVAVLVYVLNPNIS